MPPAQKKRRVESSEPKSNGVHLNGGHAIPAPPVSPASDEDKRNWQGFCEIESDPAFFNIMLKDFGVKGVKVQEVLGLDDTMLSMLPQPVYGLIFLFKYRPDTVNNQEATCPDHVWFANQTHDFACATVSLLNIVNNIPDADLGPNLHRFKDFTSDLTPAQRGDEIGNFEFVKQIHNSFARKMDMLNIDLGMENQFDDRNKKKKQQANGTKGAKKSSKITEDDYADDDGAFHFSAYVPIEGEIWKLDGLDRQPQKIGECPTDEWLAHIAPVLETRMFEYMEGQIEFALFSLVRDPLSEYRQQLVSNVRDIQAVDSTLKEIKADGTDDVAATWMSDAAGGVIWGPDAEFEITGNMLEETPVSAELREKLQSVSEDELVGFEKELVAEQWRLRTIIANEESSTEDDARRARQRRYDYGPLTYTWLRMLSEKEGVMQKLVEEIRA